MFCFCIIPSYFIVNVKLYVTEMNKCFIFFINIISVQVNHSALLNVLKKTLSSSVNSNLLSGIKSRDIKSLKDHINIIFGKQG